MPTPAGLMRDVLVLEQPEEHRNEIGETVQVAWHPVCRLRAKVEQSSYIESQNIVNQTAGSVSYVVNVRYCEDIKAGMRLRWESRRNKLLYVSGVYERGYRVEMEVTCEERV